MKLKYVGDMPQCSNKGVGFDRTQPDKYILLNAAVELLEALSYGPTETTQHLYNTGGKERSGAEIVELLRKYCDDLDALFASREEKTDHLIDELVDRVKERNDISEDGRRAWLNNIKIMRDYYMQYVVNESAYKCALDAMAKEIHDARVKEIVFPLYKNYASVLHDLTYVLGHLRPPIDADLKIEEIKGKLVGTLTIKHS
jgi:hypothetical protein